MSPKMMSPGQTLTPPQLMGTFTSPWPSLYGPRAVTPLAYTGKSILLVVSISRIGPSITIPAILRYCIRPNIFMPARLRLRPPSLSTTITSCGPANSIASWIIKLSPLLVFTVSATPSISPLTGADMRRMSESITPSRSMQSQTFAVGRPRNFSTSSISGMCRFVKTRIPTAIFIPPNFLSLDSKRLKFFRSVS